MNPLVGQEDLANSIYLLHKIVPHEPLVIYVLGEGHGLSITDLRSSWVIASKTEFVSEAVHAPYVSLLDASAARTCI